MTWLNNRWQGLHTASKQASSTAPCGQRMGYGGRCLMRFKAHTGLPLMSCSALDFDSCHTKMIGGQWQRNFSGRDHKSVSPRMIVLLMLAHTCLHVLTSTLTTANTDTSESREIVGSSSYRLLAAQAMPPKPTSPLRATHSRQPLALITPSRSVSEIDANFGWPSRYPCRINGRFLELVEISTWSSDLTS